MWHANIFGADGWREVPVVEVAGVPTLDALQQTARAKLSNEPTLLRHLESEFPGEDAWIGRQPISAFARVAEAESRAFDWSTGTKVVILDEEAIGLHFEDASAKCPSVIAWHEYTAFLLPLSSDDREIRIEFVPDSDADDREARPRHRYATKDHQLQTILDWRGYFGARSATIDGDAEMRPSGRGFVARLRGQAGYVAGRLLRRLTFGTPTMQRDPLALHRERTADTLYSGVAQMCPKLSDREVVTTPEAMVFVHGTASCGLQGLKDLYVSSAPAYPVLRFEHDTFQDLTENANELVRLIESSLRVDKLLLVAHSRGGLVARLALDGLHRDGYPAAIELKTFGTPHQGTPLAKMGGRLLSQLYKIGQWGLNMTAPMLSPLTWAHGFLFDAPELPPGIKAMEENSPALNMMNFYGEESTVECCGSRFDITGAGSGFAIEIEGILRGAMYDVDNDLVVPTSSSEGFGKKAPRLDCSHLQYFANNSVQSRLQSHFVQAAGAVLPQGADMAAARAAAWRRMRERWGPLRLKPRE